MLKRRSKNYNKMQKGTDEVSTSNDFSFIF